MAKSKGAIVIDTKLNDKKIEGDFEQLEKKTKNMINKYNKSVDSIKKQELALEKVKQKLNDIQSGNVIPTSLKEMYNQLNKNNKEMEKINQKYNELSTKGFTTSIEDKELAKLKQARIDLNQINSELIEEISIAKKTTPEVMQLTQQINNMTSSLEETKNQTNQLGTEIQESLNQKGSFLGMKNGFDDVGKKIDKFKNRMTRLVGTVAVFSLIRNGLTKLRNGFMSLLKQNDTFNDSLNQIKASLMTAFAPIYNACLPAINTLMNSLAKLAGTIAVFVSGLFGTSLEDAKKQAKDLSKSLDDVGSSGEEASGGLSSFDKLEVVGGGDSSTGASSKTGIDYSGEIQYSQNLLNTLNKIKDFVSENGDAIIGFITGVTGALVSMKLLGLDPIKNIGIGIMLAGIVLLIQDIIEFLENPTWEKFGEILIDIGLILAGLALIIGSVPMAIAAVCAVIVGIVIKYWDEIWAVLEPIVRWIYNKLIKPIIDFFAVLWESIKIGIETIKELWNSFKTKIVSIATSIKTGVVNGFNNIKDGISNAMNKVKTIISNIWNGIWSTIKGVINKIIGGVESMVNTVIKGLNKILEPLTKVGNAILEAVGIKSFSFSTIPQVKLPRLATGAVIPPRSEFAAILGDQKRGVNIETPLDTMVEAFNKALDSRDANGELVIENLTIVNRIGNTEISKTVVKGVRIAEKQLGKPLFIN